MYNLLSDFEPKGEVARRFGTHRKEGYAEHALFVIDKEARIVYKDIHKIDEQPDNEAIFDVLRKLN